MSFPFHLRCPMCKGNKVDIAFEPETLDDYVGVPCAVCGYVFTQQEIQRQLDAAVSKRFDELRSG